MAKTLIVVSAAKPTTLMIGDRKVTGTVEVAYLDEMDVIPKSGYQRPLRITTRRSQAKNN